VIASVIATALRTPEAILADPPGGRHARFLDRLGLHALDAGLEALAAAKLSTASGRIGLFVGTPGLRPRWDEMRAAFSGPNAAGPWEAGLRKLHPFWMLQHLSNNVHALLSMEARIRGEGVTFGGAAAGAEALQAATRALHANAVDAALVVAYDETVTAMVLVRPGVSSVREESS
jgi:3-oxoacyl-[acyl-carrier-protein] synthase II